MPYQQLKLPIVGQLFVVQIELESKCLANACRVTKKCMQGLGGDALVDGDMGTSSNTLLPSICRPRVQIGSKLCSNILSKVNHKNCC